MGGYKVFRYDFDLPGRPDAWYELEGHRYPVNAAYEGDLHIAYLSCNGQEEGDLDRQAAERNPMWSRICAQHGEAAFNLMLHGGDQLYADEITKTHPLSEGWPAHVPDEIRTEEEIELRRTLTESFFHRYLAFYSQPEFAWLAARVPSLAMWDDHDICDGWGSLPQRKMDSQVGRSLFSAARESFLLFQLGATERDIPLLFQDSSGTSLTWRVDLPGVSILAPDLRSERRRSRIMGEEGWKILRETLASVKNERLLVLSSVPLLGPRLSIVERLLALTPWMEKYEDDLRDQWQSRSHRVEWQAMLREVIAVHESGRTKVAVLSGEIHLATRATMKTAAGDLHQLVASGIAHPPPPKAYARVLGALARLGEAPLADHPIRLHSLPGRPGIYTAERNYLVLRRQDGIWLASWELEDSLSTRRLAV